MTNLTVDADKAERIIAQTLRDEANLLPAKANEIAAGICRRLLSSVSTPTNPLLAGNRIIRSSPPPGFEEAVSEKIADVNYRVASTLWQLVYDRGEDLPLTIADPRLY